MEEVRGLLAVVVGGGNLTEAQVEECRGYCRSLKSKQEKEFMTMFFEINEVQLETVHSWVLASLLDRRSILLFAGCSSLLRESSNHRIAWVINL